MLAAVILVASVGLAAVEPPQVAASELQYAESLLAGSGVGDADDPQVGSLATAIRAVGVRDGLCAAKDEWHRSMNARQVLESLRWRKSRLDAAPPACELGRFPDYPATAAAYRFNRAFARHLEMRIVWEADRAGPLRAALDETNKSAAAWAALLYAHESATSKYDSVYGTRTQLKSLRELLGDGWGVGAMPACVPEWAMRHESKR